MNTIRYLFTDPELKGLFWPGVLAGIAIAIVCSLLSPLVVLKRLSFVGQGISHAAFGGIGIASLLATVGGISAAGAGGVLQFPIVLAFCLACALLIAWLIERGASEADTAIGIVLVGSMTLGAILIQWAANWASHRGLQSQIQSWESILFGSIYAVDRTDAAIAWAVTVSILALARRNRRALLFWAFDEAAAPAFGIPAQSIKYLLVVLLTLAIVTAMKLAGVVLATALLVLPGAIGLRLSNRLWVVMTLSLGAGLLGVLGGLILSFETEVLPPGACIVSVLVLLLIAAYALRRVQSARSAP